MPRSPGAWLLTTARNRAVDRIRRDRTLAAKARLLEVPEADGPEAGLAIVDSLALEDYRYLHSTRADLLRRLGRTEEARDAYRRALELAQDEAERRLLERRLAELP